MTQYKCPVCHKRVCDSIRQIYISEMVENKEDDADIMIKCQRCKSILALKIADNALRITPFINTEITQ